MLMHKTLRQLDLGQGKVGVPNRYPCLPAGVIYVPSTQHHVYQQYRGLAHGILYDTFQL